MAVSDSLALYMFPLSKEAPEMKPAEISKMEQKNLTEESGDEQMLNDEREEEQTFLVNLYKFMKERHTPIERVPHLGFKQSMPFVFLLGWVPSFLVPDHLGCLL